MGVTLVKKTGNLTLQQDDTNIKLTSPAIIIGEGGGGGEGHNGDCNVYIGSDEPTTDALLWFNPEGEPVVLITEEEVDAKIAAIEIPEVDFTGYATETYVQEAVASVDVTDQLEDYALKSEIPSLDGYAKTEDIPDVSAFQTEAQVIALIEEHGGGSLPASEEGEF